MSILYTLSKRTRARANSSPKVEARARMGNCIPVVRQAL